MNETMPKWLLILLQSVAIYVSDARESGPRDFDTLSMHARAACGVVADMLCVPTPVITAAFDVAYDEAAAHTGLYVHTGRMARVAWQAMCANEVHGAALEGYVGLVDDCPLVTV